MSHLLPERPDKLPVQLLGKDCSPFIGSEASMQHKEIHIFIASYSLSMKKNLHFLIGFLSLSTRNYDYLTRLYYLGSPQEAVV